MQTRLREEVLTVGEQPDVGQLESLSYLNNFVRELVRRDASCEYPPWTLSPVRPPDSG